MIGDKYSLPFRWSSLHHTREGRALRRLQVKGSQGALLWLSLRLRRGTRTCSCRSRFTSHAPVTTDSIARASSTGHEEVALQTSGRTDLPVGMLFMPVDEGPAFVAKVSHAAYIYHVGGSKAGLMSTGATSKLAGFWNHPAGPKTIHFWAPTFKCALSTCCFANFCSKAM